MNTPRSMGLLVMAAFVAAAGVQLLNRAPTVTASHSAPVAEQSTAEIRLSAAASFADKAKRYLGRTIVFDRWVQVLTNSDGSTVCLAYAGTPNQPGVAILSDGRVSQVPEDWSLKCSEGMFDLTSAINPPKVSAPR